MSDTVIKIVLKKDAKIVDCQNLIKELMANESSESVQVICEQVEKECGINLGIKH